MDQVKNIEKKENIQFQKKVYDFFKERYIGEILELTPCSKNRHYIKFKPHADAWFQNLLNKIEVDSVDFNLKNVSGFISNSSELKIR